MAASTGRAQYRLLVVVRQGWEKSFVATGADKAQPERTAVGQHVAALDGLRGVAILAVLVFHFGAFEMFRAGHVPASFSLLPRALLMICLGGWSGVDLFFVLSGYLITT